MPRRRSLAWFDRVLVDIAGLGLALMMVMIFGLSVSRFLFSAPISDVEAITVMLLVGAVFLAFAHTQMSIGSETEPQIGAEEGLPFSVLGVLTRVLIGRPEPVGGGAAARAAAAAVGMVRHRS
jgi:NADH:ubiquinone oxidoreductase subunit 6 (subunit J)